jgi:hypothetical protein
MKLCEKCGEWPLIISRPGWYTCISCGHTETVVWVRPDYHFCDGKGKDAA